MLCRCWQCAFVGGDAKRTVQEERPVAHETERRPPVATVKLRYSCGAVAAHQIYPIRRREASPPRSASRRSAHSPSEDSGTNQIRIRKAEGHVIGPIVLQRTTISETRKSRLIPTQRIGQSSSVVVISLLRRNRAVTCGTNASCRVKPVIRGPALRWGPHQYQH
jgi:hypothetical protein